MVEAKTAWGALAGVAFGAIWLCGCGGGGDIGGIGGGGAGGAAMPGPRPDPAMPILDDTTLHAVELEMAPEDWQSIIDDSRGDTWRPANLTYDGVRVDAVGIRPSGESSRFPGNQKMSIAIKFDAFAPPGEGKFGGLKEIKLKGNVGDLSMMRERLALAVYRAAMPAAHEAGARLLVNGDVRGYYAVREVWNTDSIAARFSTPPGPLYRLRPPNGVDPYAFQGSNAATYVPLPWEPHIDHPARGDDAIPAFLQTVASAPDMLDTVEDVETLLGYLAAAALTMTTDGFVGDTGVEDHYQYFDMASGKFFILPWDTDNTFSSAGETPDRDLFSHFDTNAVSLIISSSADLRARYKAKIASLMSAMPAAAVQAEADRIAAQIKDTVYEDPVKGFPSSSFDWAVGYIKDFTAQRYANVAQQLAAAP